MSEQIENFIKLHSKEKKTNEDLNNQELTTAETEAISVRVNIRRLELELKKKMLNFGADDSRYEKIKQAVFLVMSGESDDIEVEDNLILKITILRQRAKDIEDIDTRQAAYFYAKVAQLVNANGQDPRQDIQNAERCLNACTDLDVINPSHLLPQAILLGIEKSLLRKSIVPEKTNVAKACKLDKQLLKQYALVLSDDERADFLDNFSAQERDEISVILDHSVSEFLPLQFSQSESEQSQRDAVLSRASKNLEQIVKMSDEGQIKNVLLLSQTLGRLQGEDSNRKLVEVGESGLAKAQNQKQQAIRYEYSAEILEYLFKVDVNKGGILAIKFLGKKDLPAKLFKHFFEKIILEKIITVNANKYFNDQANWPFLQKMFAQYPNQFNTVIDTLVQIKGYQPAENEVEIFQALKDLESITPIIFERYRRADNKGKKELATKIKELKPKFFRNQPIGNILPRQDREILAEMVYLAYQPVGMSFQEVQNFLEKLKDHTEDLAEFDFPEEGYPFVMKQGKSYSLKKGERLNIEKLSGYRELFSGKISQTQDEMTDIFKILERLAKAGSDFTNRDLTNLLGLMSGDQQIRSFLERHRNLTADNAYSYLNELKELLGVYFSDNYSQRLNNFFSANPKIEGKIIKILSAEARQTSLKKKLAKEGEEIDWQSLGKREEVSKALAIFIQTKVLKLIREEIAQMVNKFVESDENSTMQTKDSHQLKAYISKNLGSFFAKASAGICTASDVSLFEREDHFHINVVENDETVRGNIQAYVINDKGGGCSLVLRGFNPNSAFLDKINPGEFCETVLKIAKQFQTDNGFNHVYITESLGGWHALSNREAVTKYLQNRYVKEKKARKFNLKITDSKSVSYIYEIF